MSHYLLRAIFSLIIVFSNYICFADDSQVILPFANPVFNAHPDVEDKMGMKTVPEVILSNGSLFISSTTTKFSKLISSATFLGGRSDPLSITHCGLLITETPANILSIIDRKLSGEIPSDYPVQEVLLTHLREIIEEEFEPDARDQVAAFCYAADYLGSRFLGSMIAPLRWYLTEFNQNFFIRDILTPYSRKFTRAFIRATLGMPYVAANPLECLEGAVRMLKSIPGKGSDENTHRMWCSELLARFYDLAHPCSVMPPQFMSGAGEDSVLNSGLFSVEIPLQLSFNVSSPPSRLYRLLRCLLWGIGLYDPMLRS
ncbi:MAG: hypothetical protein LBJ77_02100 [Holosporales bacterium]|jgi:hypothetical protein|nr:hypothetical protein [Holosporales bacterium]